LPISQKTSAALESANFQSLTDIQSKAIPLGLKGRDILGAAKTGSGKTLAFLVPMLENLYRQKWSELDGLGALIISPTHELAIQIFQVLRKIGTHHNISAGLVVGGQTKVSEERERISRMNILICTPGRILQHLDQSAALEVNNLQMLILDEADRLMDRGFQTDVDHIIEHLPKERQTMLFSATQTRKVSDLARLSLRDPEYVSVHEKAESATPSTLKEHYLVTPLPDKLNTLFSFIRANLTSKIVVFLSSGKQVRFVYETFRHLRPGIPLLHLHGRQKQSARLEVTSKFSKAKESCLIATDVVARGVDFPAVDWVVQVDCPEDADTYIHRVGRTARFERVGRAVLFLDPSEVDGMLKRLEHRKVPIEKINARANKQQSIKNQLQLMLFESPEIKYLGQKAFASYARSIHVQKDKEIFKLQELDLEGFAQSMGLPGAPHIKFQKGGDAKKLKNAPRGLKMSSDEDSDSAAEGKKKKQEVRTKYDRMFERTNQDVLSSHYKNMLASDDESEDGDNILSVKRVIQPDDEQDMDPEEGTKPRIVQIGNEEVVIDSKRREKLLKSKKNLLRFKGHGKKLVYDENGEAREVYEFKDEDDFKQQGAAEQQRAKFVEEEAARIKEADLEDKALVKEKRREKKEKRKARERGEIANEDMDGDEAPELIVAGDDGDDYDPLDLLRELPLDEEEERPVKRQKKWTEDIEGDKTKKAKRMVEDVDTLETTEDYEALALRLLEE